MFSTLRKALVGVIVGLVVATASLLPTQAHAGAFSNYLVNKDLDFLFRAQTLTAPTTGYVGLATTAGTAAACGTEVTYTGYARGGDHIQPCRMVRHARRDDDRGVVGHEWHYLE